MSSKNKKRLSIIYYTISTFNYSLLRSALLVTRRNTVLVLKSRRTFSISSVEYNRAKVCSICIVIVSTNAESMY